MTQKCRVLTLSDAHKPNICPTYSLFDTEQNCVQKFFILLEIVIIIFCELLTSVLSLHIQAKGSLGLVTLKQNIGKEEPK